jgi:hypothetical protein
MIKSSITTIVTIIFFIPIVAILAVQHVVPDFVQDVIHYIAHDEVGSKVGGRVEKAAGKKVCDIHSVHRRNLMQCQKKF